MKKIAIVMNDFSGGGAEKAALLLSRGFQEAGHTVHFIVKRNQGEYGSRRAQQSSITEIGSAYFLRHGRLMHHFHSEEYDVVFSFLIHRDFLTSLILFALGTTVVPVIQNHLTGHFRDRRGYKNRLKKHLFKWSLKKFDRLIAVSTGVKKDLVQQFQIASQSIDVIPNPIDVSMITREKTNPPRIGNRVEKWLLSRNKLIAIGRLHHQKNFSFLINSFPEVVRRVDDVHLLVLGEGEKRRKLERIIQTRSLTDYVTMPGFTDNPYFFLSQAQLLIHPSRFEGCPLVLIESLALGTPIVSTNSPGGSAEVLKNGEYGTLIPVDDSVAMVEGIVRNLTVHQNDPSQLRKRAEAFDYKNIVQEYIELF